MLLEGVRLSVDEVEALRIEGGDHGPVELKHGDRTVVAQASGLATAGPQPAGGGVRAM